MTMGCQVVDTRSFRTGSTNHRGARREPHGCTKPWRVEAKLMICVALSLNVRPWPRTDWAPHLISLIPFTPPQPYPLPIIPLSSSPRTDSSYTLDSQQPWCETRRPLRLNLPTARKQQPPLPPYVLHPSLCLLHLDPGRPAHPSHLMHTNSF